MRYVPPKGYSSVLGSMHQGSLGSPQAGGVFHGQQAAQQAVALLQRQQFGPAWQLFASLGDEELSGLQLTATAAECAQRANQLTDAVRLYSIALKGQRGQTPSTLRLRFNLALVYFQLQDWGPCIEQLVKVQQASPAHKRSAELLTQARLIRANPKDIPQAIAGLRKQLAANPLDQKAIQLWAETRWLQNECDWCEPYDNALKIPGHENILVEYVMKLTSLGLLTQASDVLGTYSKNKESENKESASAHFTYAQALLFYQQGHAEKALANLRALPPAWLANYAVEELFIKALLATGAVEQALEVAKQRVTPAATAAGGAAKRIEQGDWALLATAYKKAGHWDEYRTLYDFDRFVKAYAIKTPRGFKNIESFHRGLIQELNRHHRDKNHPLNQSLRSGSQTSGHLFKRIPDEEHHIAALESAIRDQVAAYIAELPIDSTHPFLSRLKLTTKERDILFTGAWSVKLREQGFHINHFHNEGCISGCYYVQTPHALTHEGQGWIKFGQMESAQTIDDMPDFVVRPSAGTMVLFPSYMWHGTNAFTDERFRITVAFDLVLANKQS